jgi:hypothetical protein
MSAALIFVWCPEVRFEAENIPRAKRFTKFFSSLSRLKETYTPPQTVRPSYQDSGSLFRDCGLNVLSLSIVSQDAHCHRCSWRTSSGLGHSLKILLQYPINSTKGTKQCQILKRGTFHAESENIRWFPHPPDAENSCERNRGEVHKHGSHASSRRLCLYTRYMRWERVKLEPSGRVMIWPLCLK